MFTSIKTRLVIWFMIVLSILFSSLGVHLYRELEKIIIGSVDSHLHSEVQLIAGLLDVEEGMHEAELSEAAVGEYALPLSGHYYQVVSGNNILARSPSLSIVDAFLPAVPESPSPEYQTITGPDRSPLRLLTQTFHLKIGVITVQAGETLDEAYEILNSFRYIFLILFPLFLLLTWLGIAVITKLSFKKLDAFSEKVGRITERSLSERLETKGAESELKPLAVAFNTMMDRIEESFMKQRRFLSDASHDLRTPTSVIKSLCDVTLDRKRTSDEYSETLRKIERSSERMRSIIDRILSISRLDNDKYRPKRANVDLLDVVGDVMKIIRPKASEKGIETSIKGSPVVVKGDRERLIEAFINIVDNAIKYNRSGGSVRVDVRRRNDEALVTVSDTGVGIEEKEIGQIFDRFYRVDRSRGVVEGSGLGLSIAKSIIEAHNGKIGVESEAGEGSVFTITLPLTKDEDKPL